MNETTIGASKANTAKHTNGWFDMSQYEMPKMEIPAEFRAMTDNGVAHARDSYAKAKAASEEAADLLESTYAIVAKGATDYNLKLIEIARINTRAAFRLRPRAVGCEIPVGVHRAVGRAYAQAVRPPHCAK